PFTSETVAPCTPMAVSASRTSSSLKGLMMAMISFMRGLLFRCEISAAPPPLRGRRPGDVSECTRYREGHSGSADVVRIGDGAALCFLDVRIGYCDGCIETEDLGGES